MIHIPLDLQVKVLKDVREIPAGVCLFHGNAFERGLG
jgi:hypothetical protein